MAIFYFFPLNFYKNATMKSKTCQSKGIKILQKTKFCKLIHVFEMIYSKYTSHFACMTEIRHFKKFVLDL